MKFLTLIISAALAIPAFAAPKEKKAAAKKDPAPAADKAAAPAADKAAPAAEKAPAAAKKPAKPLPMNSTASEIDAAAKTFTHVTTDGKKVKHVVTEKTEIMQGKDAAKFEDIKVGDTVAGLRTKSNADGTEYEVVKITKFGQKAAKVEKKAEKKAGKVEKKADAAKEPEKKAEPAKEPEKKAEPAKEAEKK